MDLEQLDNTLDLDKNNLGIAVDMWSGMIDKQASVAVVDKQDSSGKLAVGTQLLLAVGIQLLVVGK